MTQEKIIRTNSREGENLKLEISPKEKSSDSGVARRGILKGIAASFALAPFAGEAKEKATLKKPTESKEFLKVDIVGESKKTVSAYESKNRLPIHKDIALAEKALDISDHDQENKGNKKVTLSFLVEGKAKTLSFRTSDVDYKANAGNDFVFKVGEYGVRRKDNRTDFGVNQEYIVEINKKQYPVLAVKRSPYNKEDREYVGAIKYSPSGRLLSSPEVVKSGERYLDFVIGEGVSLLSEIKDRLNSNGGLLALKREDIKKLAALLKKIIYVEHVDAAKLKNSKDKNIASNMLKDEKVEIGLNMGRSYNFLFNQAGAVGMTQMTGDTYKLIYDKYFIGTNLLPEKIDDVKDNHIILTMLALLLCADNYVYWKNRTKPDGTLVLEKDRRGKIVRELKGFRFTRFEDYVPLLVSNYNGSNRLVLDVLKQKNFTVRNGKLTDAMIDYNHSQENEGYLEKYRLLKDLI